VRVAGRLRGDRGDGVPLEARLAVDAPHLAGADDGMDARRGRGGGELDPCDAGAREGAAEKRGVQHPWEADVAGVAGLAARLLVAVEPRSVTTDDVAGPGRPLVERVLLDERPDLLVASLDLLLAPDQPRHVEIASSIRG